MDVTYTEAVRTALSDAMDQDERVFLMGEDIGLYGGAFGVTRGLLDRFGEERVRETPISEAGFTGLAVGAAMAGARPVVEIMFSDFMTLIADVMINQAAKFRYMYGEQVSVPMVVRSPSGGGRGYGPTHSQCMEALFFGVPGLKVVAPSTPEDAYSLLVNAIHDPNPVVFSEAKVLYSMKGPLTKNLEQARLGTAAIERNGSDLTLLSYGPGMRIVRETADALADKDIQAEVLDLRTVFPFDTETILASVRKTSRVVIVEESPRWWGIGTRISAMITEEAFFDLEAPPVIAAALNSPVPSAESLEKQVLPDVNNIIAAVRKVLE